MSPVRTIRKAVFPVAGLGTRFLPVTKAVPKEMLPVVDKPLIQYAVEEALEAGADTLIFVNRGDKHAITQHFTPDAALEDLLESAGKIELLETVRSIAPAGVRLEVAIQEQPLGLGHAVLCARALIEGDASFAVLLPDDMVRNPRRGALAQLAEIHAETGASVIGVEEIEPTHTDRYGIAEVEEEPSGRLKVTSLVEKPKPEVAPSNLGVVGRYVLDARIFTHLAGLGAGAGGEIQLTDAIARLLGDLPVYAHPLEGVRYDCGSRLGMLKANIDYALGEAELRAELLAYLRGHRDLRD